MIDTDRFKDLANRGDWTSLYAMLDEARGTAVFREDVRSEVHWRIAALERQQRHGEALNLLRGNAAIYDCRCYVQHKSARLLLRLGRDQEALHELSKAPFEAEMTPFYGLAIDAKFFYLYLLAKQGDPAVKKRLSDIPDDYRHVTMDRDFLTKPDIMALLKEP